MFEIISLIAVGLFGGFILAFVAFSLSILFNNWWDED